jgi:hypothetical protein
MVGEIAVGLRTPLSSITLGYFQDLGYEVDFSVADSYEVTPLFGDGSRVLPRLSLANDLRTIVPPAVVMPLLER